MKTHASNNWMKVGMFMIAMLGIVSMAQAAVLTYDFDDGTTQGWTNNVPSDITGEDYVAWDTTANNNAGRTKAQSPDYMILESDFGNRDSSDTIVKVLSSPVLDLENAFSVSIWTLGGRGAVDTPTWSDYMNLPATATSSDFMGAALRRVSDGAYLLFARRSGNGQSGRAINWLEIGWDATEVGAAIAGDDPAETYQIDLIDTFSGGWGWIGMDDVTVTEIPEPASLTLLGLAGLMFRRRRA